jgi:hypothetical protein
MLTSRRPSGIPSSGSTPQRRELRRRGRERILRFRAASLELAEIERAAVHELELRARDARRLRYRLERRTILLRQTKDQIAPALHLGQPRGIEVDGAAIFVELAPELLQRVERAIVELLQPGERRIDTLNRRERSLHVGEAFEHRALLALEYAGHPAGERLQLLGMLEPSRLLLERHVLAGLELRLIDLGDEVPQIIRAPLCLRLASGE